MPISNFLIQFFIRTISSFDTFTKDEIAKIKYSLQSILWELEKIIILGFIFGLMHKFDYFLITFIILISVRMHAGGYHSKTSLGCLLVTFMMFFMAIHVLPLLKLHYIWICALACCCLITNFMFAPIISLQKEKIVPQNKRVTRKYISSLLTGLWVIIILLNSNSPYTLPALWILVIQNIQLPIEYYRRKVRSHVKV